MSLKGFYQERSFLFQIAGIVKKSIRTGTAIAMLAVLAVSMSHPALAQDEGETVIVSTLAGKGSRSWSFVDGSTAVGFNRLHGVAIDTADNVYVTDTDYHSIYKVTPKGEVSILAGDKKGGFADGQGSAALFNWPSGIVIDAAGNLYVADTGNQRIRKITPNGEVTTIAGGEKGFADGQESTTRFQRPLGIAINAVGDLYVADAGNHSIYRVTPKGEVSILAGSENGYADGQGSAAKFRNPSGIAVDATGNLYVADSGNYSIRKVTSQGEVSTLTGGDVHLYRICDIDARCHFLKNSPHFIPSSDIAIDAAGILYVGYGGSIWKVTPKGEISTLVGGEQGFIDGPGSAARFHGLRGIAIDAAGNLYVADAWNHSIRKIEFRRPRASP